MHLPPLDHALSQALSAKRQTGAPGGAAVSVAGRGADWTAFDIICSCGPADRAFEERHASASASIVVAGGFSYRSPRGSAMLTPGAVLLGHRDTAFECGHDHGEGDRCLSFHYGQSLWEDAVRDTGAGSGFGRVSLPPHKTLSPIFARATRATVAPRDLEDLAFDLLDASLRLSRECRAPSPPSAGDERRIAMAARMLERQRSENFSLADIASAVGMTRFAFVRRYKALTGQSPYQHLMRLRLADAARLLADTDMPVTEVAYAVGFGDLSNFTKTFKSEFGASPSAFRRTAR